MNNSPVGKNYAQLGLQAHQEMHDYMEASSKTEMMVPSPVFDEAHARARQLLHCDGHMGASTFKTGDVLIGPIEDQSLPTMMERKLEK